MTVIEPEMMTAITAELVEDEGKRNRIYVDTTGNDSIGIGRNLSTVGISDDEAFYMLRNDITSAVRSLDSYPWWRGLPAPQARVMINLMFNMGPVKLSGFSHFLAAMQRHDWPAAATELRNSVWWRQVGARGPRMVQRLLSQEIGGTLPSAAARSGAEV